MSVGTLAVGEQTFITRTPLGLGWYDLEAHMLTSILLPHSENKSSSTQNALPDDTEEGSRVLDSRAPSQGEEGLSSP